MKLKEKFIGYTSENSDNLVEIISKTKSINELLHVIHSYIDNNELLLEAFIEEIFKDSEVTECYEPFQRKATENTYLFDADDDKQIAMEKGEEEIRTERIQEFEKEIKRGIDKDKEYER